MGQKRTDDRFSEREAARRLQSILRGAFTGSPTPLKDIPKKNGESRNSGYKQKKKKPR